MFIQPQPLGGAGAGQLAALPESSSSGRSSRHKQAGFWGFVLGLVDWLTTIWLAVLTVLVVLMYRKQPGLRPGLRPGRVALALLGDESPQQERQRIRS